MSSSSPAFNRLMQALISLGVALCLLGAGVFWVWRDASAATAPSVSGPVLPDWPLRASDAARIEIHTAGTRFDMVRTATGWVMPSRGNYPVQADEIAALDDAFGALMFDQAMTRDPDKFDRLGLGDPETGGAGVAVQAFDASGAVIADLVLGRARGETGVYLRRRGGVRAYAASGPALELGDPGRWLGLDFWTHEPSAIARVEIQPETGPAWQAMRAGTAQRNYELRTPSGWRLVTAGAANGVAVSGARLRFRDVMPAQALTEPPVSRYAAVTFSGLAYELRFYAEGDTRWAVIELAALADDAQPRADHFNAQVSGWAFAVSPDAYERLTRPLDQVAEPQGVPNP